VVFKFLVDKLGLGMICTLAGFFSVPGWNKNCLLPSLAVRGTGGITCKLSLAGEALLDPDGLLASVLLLGLSGIWICKDRCFFVASGRLMFSVYLRII
jgi:hypothetical protein